MPLLTRRELTAAAVAPLAAPLGYWLLLTIYGFASWLGSQRRYGVRSPSLAEIVRPLVPILVVGAPIAWAAALVGLPIYVLVRGAASGVALDGGRRVALLAVSAAIGAAVAWLMKPNLGRDLFQIPFPSWLGALLGVAAGAAFLRLLSR